LLILLLILFALCSLLFSTIYQTASKISRTFLDTEDFLPK
jgi:hypothetical protein